MIDKNALIQACASLFDSELGKKVYNDISRAISEHNMLDYINRGVLVGFSGGPDSVLLLIFLWNLRKKQNFVLKAMHINHLIRGIDADRDESFSKEMSGALGIEFFFERINVPEIAQSEKRGIEEMARSVRYSAFDKLLSEAHDIKTIATAHNSTDNLETFIFNFMRGSGARGLSGINPIRNNIIRPLLYVSKENVLALLNEAKIPFVTDQTNFSLEYTRNYIRHEIIPTFKRLTLNPELMAEKSICNLRCDAEYMDSVANDFYTDHVTDGKIKTADLRGLHPAIFARVIRLITEALNAPVPEKCHVDSLRKLLDSGKSFEMDLPGGITVLSDSYYTHAARKCDLQSLESLLKPLNVGFNEIPELNVAIAVSYDKYEDFSSNVYKFSIQADLSSAIIVDGLSVRTKKDGDSYFYGGMTRKVKKLFTDKKIPPKERISIPIITDSSGIVWIPGFGVRNDSPKDKKHIWISVYTKQTDKSTTN